MNIFILDENVDTCAKYHCDKHVVKMILESVQMLCTVGHTIGAPEPFYKKTHVKHPCTLWVMESKQNALFLVELIHALDNEYRNRFKHTNSHLSVRKLNDYGVERIIDLLPDINRTNFAQCMPEQYKVDNDAVSAYRNYYVGEKKNFATWRNEVPEWYISLE